jgi:hypothetical protein
MSNQQVERLSALLARVQRNRSLPRGDNGAVSKTQAGVGAPAAPPAPAKPRVETAKVAPAPVPPPKAAPAPAPAQMAAPVPPPAAAPARGKAAPTPLEMALEGRLSRPMETATQPPEVVPPPAATAPVREGRVLAEPIVPEPSKPIVQVVSKQPPHTVASFGELLRRSLSLRPR